MLTNQAAADHYQPVYFSSTRCTLLLRQRELAVTTPDLLQTKPQTKPQTRAQLALLERQQVSTAKFQQWLTDLSNSLDCGGAQ